MLVMKNLSERLKYALDEAQINQSELARRVGVTRGAVSLWFKGATNSLDGENLLKTAQALGFSASWLATGKGPMKREGSAPMSMHYPPLLEETVGVIPDPDGSSMVLVVFRDVNGTQVTLKLSDAAARDLSRKLAEQGR